MVSSTGRHATRPGWRPRWAPQKAWSGPETRIFWARFVAQGATKGAEILWAVSSSVVGQRRRPLRFVGRAPFGRSGPGGVVHRRLALATAAPGRSQRPRLPAGQEHETGHA